MMRTEVQPECEGIEWQGIEVSDRRSSAKRLSDPEVSLLRVLVRTSLDLESRSSWKQPCLVVLGVLLSVATDRPVYASAVEL